MKKINITTVLILTLLLNSNVYAQFADFKLSDAIPKTKSITESKLYNPEFKNSFIYLKTYGITIFKQITDLNLVDAKTLLIKNTIEYPKFENYNQFYVITQKYSDNISDCILDLNQNLFLMYKKKINITSEISYVKINEKFKVSEKPISLFTIKNKYSVSFVKNKKKDICAFYQTVEDNDKKIKNFYYYIYNNELKLIKSDSIISSFDDKDKYSVSVYENGFSINKENGYLNTITFTDIKNNISKTIDITDSPKKLYVYKIEIINNEHLLICGNHHFGNADKSKTNGVYRFKYNINSNVFDEKIYSELKIRGNTYKGEESMVKNIENLVITDKGECFYLISQTVKEVVNNITNYSSCKFELMYIGDNNTKWNKQLPIVGLSWHYIDMYCLNNNLILSYIDYENRYDKIDFNNYIFGKPMPNPGFTGSSPNTSILKINTEGNIQHQVLKEIHCNEIMNYNNEYFGLSRDNNGFTYSNCKLFNITFKKE